MSAAVKAGVIASSAVVAVVSIPAAAIWYVFHSIATGTASLDRIAIRGRIALRSLLTFGPHVVFDLAKPRALMAIVRNESNGDPANYLGDTNLPDGPSVGPMQVYRKTAVKYGLWTPPAGEDAEAAYGELSTDEGQGIAWGVAVFKHKLDENGGDLQKAITAYNGTGEAADEYATKAMAFMATTWDQDIPAAEEG